MKLRRWLFAAAALCATTGAATLALALCCMFDLVGGHCELWLLGPFVALPLGLGLGLIGRAAGTPAQLASLEISESHGCGEREEA